MGVRAQIDEYIGSLELDARGLALAEVARALADEVDDPPSSKDGKASVTAPARELRACLADLQVIGANRGDESEDKGWGTIASIARNASVRDAARPEPADKGSGSRRGGKAAG